MKCSFIGGLFFILIATGCSSKSSPAGAQKVGNTTDAKNTIIDWEGYDASSTVPQDSIRSENLQGLWSAYEGVFRFGNNISTMKLNVPFIIEIKDGNCRRNEKDEFQKFSIKENLLIVPGNNKPDTGIINKLTRQQLIISWKRDANYTRYYYKK
ncbi:MAG: hypothetical protein ABJC98_15140 [Bacteroidota bacterium]